MSDETPTLSIKDIVLLKERPQDYLKIHAERLTKTHDGTSSGPLKKPIRRVIGASIDSYYRYTEVYSANGDELWNTDDSEWADGGDVNITITDGDYLEPITDETEAIVEDLGKFKDANIISKPTYDNESNGNNRAFFDKNGNKHLMPTVEEGERLMMQDEDGNYLFRSQTIIGDDATSVTLIRDNKFSPENHEAYSQMLNDMNADISKHHSQVVKRAREIERELVDWDIFDETRRPHQTDKEIVDSRKAWQAHQRKIALQSRRMAVEELGDTKTYIKENWGPQLEKEHVKIKMQSYDGKVRHDSENYWNNYLPDQVEYQETWGEWNGYIYGTSDKYPSYDDYYDFE